MKRYLVVAEDDEDDRMFMETTLTKIGFSNPVYFVHNGHQLIEHLKSCEDLLPALVLMDVNMPKINGYEALKFIKSHQLCRQIKVVMFSTSCTQHDILRCMEAGADDYITKPGTMEEMEKAIAGVLLKYGYLYS